MILLYALGILVLAAITGWYTGKIIRNDIPDEITYEEYLLVNGLQDTQEEKDYFYSMYF